ncbi:sugar phosphate isomerase/epimerase family protein [Botryobacter ruber]|uniref:sugar phosphate isomerase/epimerase family protein n=1 Tax=Botryobacter ruber TaxID=2171629 RepID=UPI001F0CB444|nr:TIM barrel protein [Botryobacter ruber]
MTTFSRRQFLTALTGAVALAPVLAHARNPNKKLQLKFMCPRWGATDSWDEFCRRVKEAGYDGVETPAPKNEKELQEMLAALKRYRLELVVMALPGPSDVSVHQKVFEEILRSGAALKPLFINCQTGKDFFSFEQNRSIIEVAARVSRETGVKIIHETHRGKFSFAAQVTRQFIEALPDLRLTLDISHWCNVSESLLENQQEAVELAISRTEHVHARIGHQQGPQVNDPRAPEWQKAVNAHLAWWDKVVAAHLHRGSPYLTITPEFGPPNYMPTKPYSREPLASQWEVNVHMMELLKKRYLA